MTFGNGCNLAISAARPKTWAVVAWIGMVGMVGMVGIGMVASPTGHAVAQQPNERASGVVVTVTTEVIVDNLATASDFSVAPDGETVFVAELENRNVRRLRRKDDAVVITDIVGQEKQDNLPKSIHLHAISNHRVLVGVAGFKSARRALTLFDISSADALPLVFEDEQTTPLRSFQRIVKRSESFDVIKIFSQPRGITVASQTQGRPPTLHDVRLRGGNLNQFTSGDYEALIADRVDLSTLAIETMGGYLVAAAAGGGSDNDAARTTLCYMQGDGKPMQDFQIDVTDVVAIAFSPNHHRLFVLGRRVNQDLTEKATSSPGLDRRPANGLASEKRRPPKNDSAGIPLSQIQVGVFEITSSVSDADAQGVCESQMIAPLDRPVAMKFDAAGKLWVLDQASENRADGRLLKISGLDVRSPSRIQTSPN